jgi:hypothetical protein
MATTVIHKIARFTVGVAVAGMLLGQTGTAFASEDSTIAAAPPRHRPPPRSRCT